MRGTMRHPLPILDQSLRVVADSSTWRLPGPLSADFFQHEASQEGGLIGVISVITSLSCHERTLEADLFRFSLVSRPSRNFVQRNAAAAEF